MSDMNVITADWDGLSVITTSGGTGTITIASQGTQGPAGPAGSPGEVPEAPLDGQQYARRAAGWVGIVRIHVGSTAPSNPGVGDIWIDTT